MLLMMATNREISDMGATLLSFALSCVSFGRFIGISMRTTTACYLC